MCSISLLLFALAFTWTLVSAAPYPILPSLTSLSKVAKQSISDRIETINFRVPCTRCPSLFQDDVALDFELQYPRLSSSTNLCDVPFALNGQPVTVDQRNLGQVSTLHLPAGNAHDKWEVDIVVQGLCDSTKGDSFTAQRAFFFNVTSVAQQPLDTPDSVTLVVGKSEAAQLLIDSEITEQADCAADLKSVINETSSIFTEIEAIPTDNDIKSKPDIDLVEHILRRRLYDQATRLQKLNQDCRKNTVENLADCHHDLSCMARVMCQRIHDTTLTKIKEIQASLEGSVMISNGRNMVQQAMPIVDDGSDSDWDATSVDGLLAGINQAKDQKNDKNDHDSQHPVVLALEILAAALGLTALCAFLRRRFCSLRCRVERLADKEERRRARHFRRLARKEALRKKWVSFKQVFKRSPRNGDYEEKRALVIEAAGGVIDDYAEEAYNNSNDPEMGNALGGLRSAHDFVAGLVRVRKNSNAGSGTTTLPEYSSEKLPDYTSTPEDCSYAPSVASRESMNTRMTPDSSIIMTPRCSRETLRTGTDFSNE
ncbi:hypothetical protein D6D13_02436 [Aureobasidium pullulans]|uniref:Uncharacterized protein n=1 Tax=Aureobasidium pullulans TaxID=5580 RepID=A0A4S9D4K1_AURPU|nr:hypothetical protein D6D13_02436 [Aureobasidium pullulans]